MAHEELVGAWKLVSHQFVATQTGESRDMFGDNPLGSLLITEDMQMAVLITRSDRQTADGPAALFGSLLAYAGKLRIEGEDQFVTSVEISWLPDWVGADQVRTFSIEGNVLSIMTKEMMHPMFPNQPARAILKFTRA